jgi:ABC-type transporter Mla subunit MlaD
VAKYTATRYACGMVVDMSQKIPGPKDVKAAVQAAAETAQSVAGGAMRIPPASIQLASQLPDLVENLATATERLNQAIDRAERYLALADPMIRTMDAILPQLEALVATGNDVFNAVSSVPGVSTLSRLATRGSEAATRKVPPRTRTPKKP